MKFICVMGRSNSGKSTVVNQLVKMGFKKSISYTSRKPEVRDGKLEKDGEEYRFVTEEELMELFKKGKIVEYERYRENLYGTPVPCGAKRYVSTMCYGGFKALREIYGEQVVGVYLKCDKDTAISRGNLRDVNNLSIERLEQDDKLAELMESSADIVVNANQDTNSVLADILKALKEKI